MEPKVAIDRERISTLCRRWGIRELALFGSVLREDFRQDSDIDVLVEFGGEIAIGLIQFNQIREELVEILGRPVDLISKRGLRPRMREVVVASARTIYASA